MTGMRHTLPGRLMRFATVYAFWAFLLTSFLPIWEHWYVGVWEATGSYGGFWQILPTLDGFFRRADPWGTLLHYYDVELVKLLLIMLAGAGVGVWQCLRPVSPQQGRPSRSS